MKRFFSILLITALLIGLTPLVASVALAEDYATVISNNGYGVRLREGPSKAYNVIKVYDVGTTVNVKQKGLEWSQLQIGDTVGWMMNQYLNFGAVGNVTSGGAIAGIGNATVISDNGLRVWLRTRPSGTRIRLYSPGTAVTVLERGDTWTRISIGGSIGYMMSRYLSFEQVSVPAPGSKKVTAVSVNYPYPVAGDTLEAKITPEDATVKYSWKVGGVEQSTSSTLVVLARYADKEIQLTVEGIGAYTGSATYTTGKVVTSKWIDSVQLSKNEPVVGDTLTAVLKPSSATVMYSWRVGGVEVSTEASYTVRESDIGKMIQLKVTAIDGFNGAAACSATAVVMSNKVLSAATVSNTQPIAGDVLSYTVQPAGATTSCVWKADGEVVANVASYKVTQKDIGKVITVTVTGTGEYSGTVIGSTAKVASARLASVKIGTASPVAEQTIYAVPDPAGATASYTWYADGIERETNATPQYQVRAEDVGKKLTVKAVGTGAYTGTATSAATNAVVSNKKITAVTLSNTTPVVGDVIGVTLTPRDTNDHKNEHSYVWTIGNRTESGMGMSTYTVKPEDAGLAIRVRVVGVNPYSGDVYSAYTSAVATSGKVTGVSLKNNSTGANAASASPEVGQTLKAVVSPAQAQAANAVAYTWKVDGKAIANNGDTYVVGEGDVGKQISVTVKGTGKYVGDGKTTYTATSAKAVQYKKLTINLNIPQPVAGNRPTYSAKVDKQWSASIQWVDKDGNTAKMDEAGLFLPGTEYVAKVTFTPASGYTMIGATVTANGATVAGPIGSDVRVYTCTYASTASIQVNDYYITCISRPVPGQTSADWFVDTQYDGEIVWIGPEVDAKTGNLQYTAQITLFAKSGYTFANVPANVFEVAGADSVSSQAGGDNSLSVTAKYVVKPTVVISADTTQVELDGITRRVVSCLAELQNGPADVTSVEWFVTGAMTDATSMVEETGKLIVGPEEPVDRDLIVHAKITAGDAVYTGTLKIHLVGGTAESTGIKVEFYQPPVSAQYGDTVQFSATASNSVLGVTWSLGENILSTIDKTTGKLTIDPAETAPQVVVKATSIEDPSKTATHLLIMRPRGQVFVSPDAITLNAASQMTFTAEVYGVDPTGVKWSMSGNTSADTTISPSQDTLTCTLNLGYNEGAEKIQLKATLGNNISATAVVTVNKTIVQDEAGIDGYALTDGEGLIAAQNLEDGPEIILLPAAGTVEPDKTSDEQETDGQEAEAPAVDGESTDEANKTSDEQETDGQEAEAPAADGEGTEESTAAVTRPISKAPQMLMSAAPIQNAVSAAAPEKAPNEEPTEGDEETPADDADKEEAPLTEATVVISDTPASVKSDAPAADENKASEDESEDEGDDSQSGIMNLSLVEDDAPVTGETPAQTPSTESEDESEDEEDENEGTGGIVITDMEGKVVSSSGLAQSDASNEPEAKADEENKTPEKAAGAKQEGNVPEQTELTEEQKLALEEELDDPNNSDNIGKSSVNASNISIEFIESVDTLKRGGTATFKVEVTGSDENVIWYVLHSGMNEEGARYSTIKSDGKSATLSVGAGETSNKLTVSAVIPKTDEHDKIFARCVVTISDAAVKKPASNDETNKSDAPATEETTSPTQPATDSSNAPAADGTNEPSKELTEEELGKMAQQEENGGDGDDEPTEEQKRNMETLKGL